MAISGPASYVSTTQEFFAHWEDVNTFLGAAVDLELEGGVTREDFEDKRVELLAMRDAVEDGAMDLGLTRATLQIKKEWLLDQLGSFKSKLAAVASASAYARVVPAVPTITMAQEGFSRPLTQAAKLWKKFNAAPPVGATAPLVLKDGTTQALFEAALAEMTELYEQVVDEEQDVALALARRNDGQEVLYGWMKKYRVAVEAAVPDGSALLETLPRLTATSSRTPEPVALTGSWNAATAKADLTAALSSDPDVAEYQLRACPGPEYDQELEAVVATVKKGTPPVFHTDKFLTHAGEVASYRVYVVLTSGGEAGSDTLVVTRG